MPLNNGHFNIISKNSFIKITLIVGNPTDIFIQIDEEKCNGCGACALACHEGAIGMVGGKVKLLRDDYCDGLGNCVPAVPQEAELLQWPEFWDKVYILFRLKTLSESF